MTLVPAAKYPAGIPEAVGASCGVAFPCAQSSGRSVNAVRKGGRGRDRVNESILDPRRRGTVRCVLGLCGFAARNIFAKSQPSTNVSAERRFRLAVLGLRLGRRCIANCSRRRHLSVNISRGHFDMPGAQAGGRWSNRPNYGKVAKEKHKSTKAGLALFAPASVDFRIRPVHRNLHGSIDTCRAVAARRRRVGRRAGRRHAKRSRRETLGKLEAEGNHRRRRFRWPAIRSSAPGPMTPEDAPQVRREGARPGKT